MKNLKPFIIILAIILFAGSGCNKIISKFSDKYKQSGCRIDGDNELQTAADYLRHGIAHLEKDPLNSDNRENECSFYACNQAVMMDSGNAEAYSCRGAAYAVYQRDYKRAINDYDTAISLNPVSVYYYRRAVVYERDSKLEESLADLGKFYELTSDPALKANTKFDMARLQLKRNQFDTALTDINEAIALKPDSTRAYQLRASIYRALDKGDLAEADERKAKELAILKDDKSSSPREKDTPASASPSKTISVGILNAKAVNLIQPVYPQTANAVHASGVVNVQVTIDEKGDVIQASAVSGHPLLKPAAETAAATSKFSPTLAGGKPVKVTGIITYNFTPQ